MQVSMSSLPPVHCPPSPPEGASVHVPTNPRRPRSLKRTGADVMRQVFCQSLVERASRADFAFLTGDLGLKARDPLRDALGERFVNAGVAEQNMVSVAAGLARNGLRAW